MERIKEERLFNRFFIFIWITSFALNLTQNSLNNVISLYVRSLGMSTSFAGFLAIPFAIFAILMRFVGGYWADRYGRRSLMVFSCAGYALTAFLFGAIPAAAALVIFRAIHGFCYAGGQLAGSTISVDVTPRDRTTEGVGIYWTATALSYGLSGYVVTLLISGGSYSPVFTVCAAASLLGAVFAFLCNYEKKGAFVRREDPAVPSDGEAPAYTGLLRFVEPKVYRSAVLLFLMAFANCAATMFLLLFAQEQGYRNGGLALVMAAIFMACGNLGSDLFMKKLGCRNTLLLTFTFCAASFVAMGLVHSPATYLLGGAACGFIQGICMPVLYYLAVRDMPVHRRGVAGGTIYFMLDLGVGLGSYVWGILIDASSFTVMYFTAGLVFLAGSLCSYLFFKNEPASP